MKPRLAALAAVLLWGASFVATRAALSELTPVTLEALRLARHVFEGVVDRLPFETRP
ncbi:MAG TPA: hypothetical protein VMS76_09805 [Planctomycetota bacterium]|nr:hypothetical protein [Planctomycetota bacterium]